MRTVLALLFGLMVAGGSAAQTSPPNPPADAQSKSDSGPQSQATPQAGTESTGLKAAQSATLAVKFVSIAPADFRASRIMGADVYNNQDEEVGEISDLIFKDGKTISAVVVSVGGFLGLGESYVALDPHTVVLNKRDDEWAAYVNTSKDDLRDAPKIQYERDK